jgi:hypothetical protein
MACRDAQRSDLSAVGAKWIAADNHSIIEASQT